MESEAKWDAFWLMPSQFLQRGEALLKEAQTANDPIRLHYAALEARFCIEAILSRYLRSTIRDRPTKKEEKLWGEARVRETILKAYPDFIDRLRFFATWQKSQGLTEPIDVPDLDLLATHYGKIGRFLHHPGLKFFDFYGEGICAELALLLAEILPYLRRFCYNETPPLMMTPRLMAIFREAQEQGHTEEWIISKIRPPSPRWRPL